ncbi:pilX N-terminal family protein [Collimonas arenae]|uniref:PilX N-terminal family protein n=2 Tax=Collimonas arenae TaxID=279058 RepID=A0A127PX44_9BURK|nr:PilX N-terminal domain-containing pilus assembly protein [Collimonas arenae]AMP02383.1 pilX N-terminal family protein [Collimonas arenae]AMP12279.1 pilX N-terminal family protein [Collimonas arenae]
MSPPRFVCAAGVVLPVLLIFLLATMVLAFAALRSATVEELMAANANDRLLAFQEAERALRFCENQLQMTPIPVTLPQLEQGPQPAGGKVTKSHWEIAENWRSDSVSVAVPDISGPATAARCMVERLQLQPGMRFHLEPPPPRPAFRITARAVGAGGSATVMLQSYLLL